jgi:hypothetical protein
MSDRRRDPARRARFDEVREAKIARLRRVCRDWSRREIEQLAARMTRLELKYGAWSGLGGYRDPLET